MLAPLEKAGARNLNIEREKTREDKSDRNLSGKNILLVISVGSVNWWWERRRRRRKRWARNRKSLSVALFLSPLTIGFSLWRSLLFTGECYSARRMLRYRHFISFLLFFFVSFLSSNARWDLTFLNHWVVPYHISDKKNETSFVMRWLNTFNSIASLRRHCCSGLIGCMSACLPVVANPCPTVWKQECCYVLRDLIDARGVCSVDRSIDRWFDLQHCSSSSIWTSTFFSQVAVVVVVFSSSSSDTSMSLW